MNSIWNNLYDHAKDRRYGALFFSSIVALISVFFLGVLVCNLLDVVDFSSWNLPDYLLRLAPGLVLLLVALVWRVIRLARRQRENKFKREELSRDEIRKARSKLVNRNKL